MNLEKIKKLVENAQGIPNAVIEYNGELPDLAGIKADRFFGVPARFNPEVSPEIECNLIYKLS